MLFVLLVLFVALFVWPVVFVARGVLMSVVFAALSSSIL